MGTMMVISVFEAKQTWEAQLERGTRERIALNATRMHLPKVLRALMSLIF